MRYRRLGRTNLEVSAIALGTVELGMDYGIRVPEQYGRPPENEAIALVHAALDAGINFIDTARSYGDSERVLGRALKQRREQVVLATKVSMQNNDGTTPKGELLRQRMLDSLETSLEELQMEWVDIWQIHNFDASHLAQIDLLSEVFEDVRQQGRVRWFGATTYGLEMPQAAIDCGLFDVVQVTYSVLDQRLADDVFPLAIEHDIGIIARSVLLQGVLTERGDHLPDHLHILKDRSRQFRRLVAQSGFDLSPAQVAIGFGLAAQEISAVLLGVRSQAELEEDLEALAMPLPQDVLAQFANLRLDDSDLLNPATWNLNS